MKAIFTKKTGSQVFLIAPLFFLWVLAVTGGFNGLYGQDSHAYLQYSEELVHHWKTGAPKPYFFWPEGYPALGALLSFTGLGCLHALQLISFLALAGSLFLARKCMKLLWGKDATLWLILAAVTQIYFVRSGFLVMSDILSAYFILWVIYAVLRYRENHNFRFLLIILVASAGAFFVRYASVVVLFVPLIYTAYLVFSNMRMPFRIVTGIVLTGAALVLILLNNWFLAELMQRAENWSLAHIYQRTIHSRDGIVTNTVPNGLYVFGNFFHLGFLSCGALLVPFYKKLDRNSLFILIPVGVYLLFLAGLDTQNYRFLVVVHLLVVIALFPAFSAAFEAVKKPLFKWGIVSGIVIVNGVVGWYSFRKMYAVHAMEKQISKEIKLIEQGEPIYSFYVDQSFPSYGLHNEVHNFFLEECIRFERGALVVFNEPQFAVQWKGQRVMRNWKRLTENYQLDTLRQLDNNWTIYRIR